MDFYGSSANLTNATNQCQNSSELETVPEFCNKFQNSTRITRALCTIHWIIQNVSVISSLYTFFPHFPRVYQTVSSVSRQLCENFTKWLTGITIWIESWTNFLNLYRIPRIAHAFCDNITIFRISDLRKFS